MNPLFSSLMSGDESNAAQAHENVQSTQETSSITLQTAQLEAMVADSQTLLTEQVPAGVEKTLSDSDFIAFSLAPFWQQQQALYQQAGPKLWQQGLMGHDISHSPTMVNSYCQILVKYLLDGLYNGAIDSSQPIYVLEPGAGCGRFAILALQRLDALLSEYGLENIKLCYLISEYSEKNREFIQKHPYLQPYLDAGKAKVIDADSAFFHANNNLGEDSKATSEIIDYQALTQQAGATDERLKDATQSGEAKAEDNKNQGKNPLIVFANHFFSRLPQELFYLHYGQLYLCELLTQHRANEENKAQSAAQENHNLSDALSHYRWKKIDDLDAWLATQDKALQPLLTQELNNYLARLPHQPLLLPMAAISALTKLQQQHPQGMMLLTADFGPASLDELKQLQLKTSKPTPLAAQGLSTFSAEQALLTPAQISQLALPGTSGNNSHFWPLNLVHLTHWAAQYQGLSRTIKSHRQGTAFNITLIGKEYRDFVMTKQAADLYLANINPDDGETVKKSLRGAVQVLTEQEILSHLRTSDYDPELLKLFLPRLLDQGVLINARISWCQTLSQVWQNYMPIGGYNLVDYKQGGQQQGKQEQADEFAFKLGLLAIDLSHWSLAKACFISCIHWYGESTAVFHNLALVCQATNELELALNFVKLALALSPDDIQATQLHANIIGYQKYCDKLSWFNSQKVNVSSEISLIPLASQHTNEFYLQYRDRQTAPLTRSFQLTSPAEVQAAISHWQEDKQRASYALVHAELGFVGCTSLEFSSKDQELQQEVQHPLTGEVKSNEHSAYFSFWIGADYQNKGFGQQAALLCIEQAKAMAKKGKLEQLITSVWGFNACSRHVLEKVGFKVQTTEPEKVQQQEVFYALSLFPEDDLQHEIEIESQASLA